MDVKNTQEFATYREDQYNRHVLNKYDYASDGILNKTLPKVLFKGNPILVTFLQLIDMRMILLLKYIDRIKQFKHISKY